MSEEGRYDNLQAQWQAGRRVSFLQGPP